MPFHFLSHPWEVRNLQDGLLVRMAHRDLDALTVPALADELYDLVVENGLKNLYLDMGQIQHITSMAIGKLLSLDTRLHRIDGRLILTNLDPSVHQILQAANIAEILDIREREYQQV
jgi:anti-sigma B factor antagonist